jgi:hypothetical protein
VVTGARVVDTEAEDRRRATRPPGRRRAGITSSPIPGGCPAAVHAGTGTGRSGPFSAEAGTPRTPAPAPARRPVPGAAARLRGASRWLVGLVPTLTGTPFTFCYSLVLLGTGLFAHLGDPRTVHDLLAGSSSDVSNLAQRPLFTLLASGVWVAGGIISPYLLAFLLVLTSLERRIGGLRTAGVFLLGHVLATLLTEIPVAASVAVGHLPDSSLRRLDYGVSYGLIACTGALAGLLRPRLGWALVGGIGLALVAGSLADVADPLTDWGHGLALLIGVGCRPYARDVAERRRGAESPVPIDGPVPRGG